jgi:hypothetical protein
MSDALRERYPASKELHEPNPEQVELEADRKRAAETPSAREKFFESRPELEALTREPVTSTNKAQVFDAVKSARLENLKAAFASQKHDLTDEEQKFSADVLGLRISRVGSVRQLIDDVHIDAGQDFARAVVDSRDLRAMKARHEKLKSRYRTAPDLDLTPETFVVRPL